MGDLTKNFSRAEFACKCGCGTNAINHMLVLFLQKIRDHFDKPIKVVSGLRCAKRNAQVGGAKHSQHLLGNAADIVIDGVKPKEVAAFAATLMPGWGGIKAYPRFTHIDVRSGVWRG